MSKIQDNCISIVLKYLRLGGLIQQPGDMAEVGMSEDGMIGLVRGDELIIVEWDVNSFFRWCQKLTKEELVILAGNNALREMSNERIAERERKHFASSVATSV